MTKMYMKELPSVEFLEECFKYEQASGFLIWKERPEKHFDEKWKHKRQLNTHAGVIAGHKTSNGYWSVSINKEIFQVHRIIWKMFKGVDPTEDIDHIDGNRANNKIKNLQSISHRENVWKGSRSGACQMANGLWLARISKSFDNFEDCAKFYKIVSDFADEAYYKVMGGKKIPLPT